MVSDLFHVLPLFQSAGCGSPSHLEFPHCAGRVRDRTLKNRCVGSLEIIVCSFKMVININFVAVGTFYLMKVA